MNHKKTIAAILKETAELKSHKEKVEHLKKHESKALRYILMCTYDKKRVEFHVPDTEPPYRPSDVVDNEGVIYRLAEKRIPYLVKGQLGPNMMQMKREQLFISMLEQVHPDDAQVLINMIKQNPIEGISKHDINGAFPNTVADQRTGKL